MLISIAGQISDGYLDGNGVHVEAGDGVGRKIQMVVLILRCGQDATSRAGAEIEGVKGCAQVDEEGVGNRAGKDADVPAVALHCVDTLLR
jgi:hypothetical protein